MTWVILNQCGIRTFFLLIYKFPDIAVDLICFTEWESQNMLPMDCDILFLLSNSRSHRKQCISKQGFIHQIEHFSNRKSSKNDTSLSGAQIDYRVKSADSDGEIPKV